MSIKVLAVDDSRTMRDMVRHALVTAGMEVVVAEDGQHGLEVLAESNPDLIITDINMPRMDGFGFIQAVRAGTLAPSIPILVLTTESAPELKEKAKHAGATGWIVKPFDREKLVAAIRKVTV